MKRPWLLLLIFPVFIIVLFSCSGLFGELETVDTTCEFPITVPVYGINGVITEFTSPPLKSEFTLNEDGWYLLETKEPEWETFYGPIYAKVEIAKKHFRQLFAYNGTTSPAVDYQDPYGFDQFFAIKNIGSNSCSEAQKSFQTYREITSVRIDYRLYCNKHTQYCTDVNTRNDKTYVTVTSPGGSYVKYVIPSAWFDQIFRHAFLGEEPFVFEPQFFSQDTLFGQTEYGQSLLNSLFSGNSTMLGEEVISFKFAVDDFEGRKELQPVLITALQVSAAQSSSPVAFMAQAMLTGGQFETGEVRFDTSTESVSFLFYHRTESESSFVQNMQSRYEDLLSGSVFMTIPAP